MNHTRHPLPVALVVAYFFRVNQSEIGAQTSPRAWRFVAAVAFWIAVMILWTFI